MIVTLPWPPKQLSPNHRTRSPRYRAQIVRQYRLQCAELCWQAGIRPDCGATVAGIVFRPARAGTDFDNSVARFKAGQDGIADALARDDRNFRPTYAMADPVKGGAVEVTFSIPG